MNKKKAFTLPEVLISMTILMIVLALVTSLVVVVSKVTQSQREMRQCEDEYLKASQVVDLFVDTYSVYPFKIDEIQSNQSNIKITDDTNSYSLNYDEAKNCLTAQIIDWSTNNVQTKEIDFEKITKINFYIQNNLIKCEYIFESYPTYTNIVIFGVD